MYPEANYKQHDKCKITIFNRRYILKLLRFSLVFRDPPYVGHLQKIPCLTYHLTRQPFQPWRRVTYLHTKRLVQVASEFTRWLMLRNLCMFSLFFKGRVIKKKKYLTWSKPCKKKTRKMKEKRKTASSPPRNEGMSPLKGTMDQKERLMAYIFQPYHLYRSWLLYIGVSLGCPSDLLVVLFVIINNSRGDDFLRVSDLPAGGFKYFFNVHPNLGRWSNLTN